MFNGELYIFGAKSTAIGVIRAIRKLYPQCNINGCIVSSYEDNPRQIEGINVEELKSFAARISDEEKNKVSILIATPIYVQQEITGTLNMFGFSNIQNLDSLTEAKLMGDYYRKNNMFLSIKDINKSDNNVKVCVFKVKNLADNALNYAQKDEPWVKDIQVGADLTKNIFAEITDNIGDNISDKNPTYCELTALYSMWKGGLLNELDNDDYCGIYQYRRALDVSTDNLIECKKADVDVILPYPMIHCPDIKEHHTRYTNEDEWNMLLKAVSELSPEYYDDYENIFSGEFMYNYNMFITKKSIFNDFCAWMFPILFRTEELCDASDFEPRKRYLAYFGESLTTWYFMHNKDKYKIVHTGRILRS